MMTFRALLPSLLFFSVFAHPEGLQPFTSDGCSSFPEGTPWQNQLWLECCTLHDYAYWKGGTYQQRLDADRELEACVARVGEPEIALLMLAGVRVGGSPFFPTPFRWGYGWPYPRKYGSLTENELKEIELFAPQLPSQFAPQSQFSPQSE